jgi:hypothetical protein
MPAFAGMTGQASKSEKEEKYLAYSRNIGYGCKIAVKAETLISNPPMPPGVLKIVLKLDRHHDLALAGFGRRAALPVEARAPLALAAREATCAPEPSSKLAPACGDGAAPEGESALKL